MDILAEPRRDDELCRSVCAGDLSGIRYAIHELEKDDHLPKRIWTRAMIACISNKNMDALRILLEHGDANELVMEEAVKTEDIEILRILLDHGWPVDHSLRKGSIPSILRYHVQRSSNATPLT